MPAAIWLTETSNAARVAFALPSETEMPMLVKLPTSLAPGVPQSRPETLSNWAQAGLRAIENSSASPSGSLALGRNS